MSFFLCNLLCIRYDFIFEFFVWFWVVGGYDNVFDFKKYDNFINIVFLFFGICYVFLMISFMGFCYVVFEF